MKSRIIHLAIMALTIGVIGTSCNSEQRKINEAQRISDSMDHPKNLVDTLNTDRQDWEKYKLDAQARIKQNQDSIAAFKNKVAKTQGKAQDKYNEKVALLEEYNGQLKKRVDEYKEEGRENWTKFKQDFNNDLDTLDLRMKEVFAVDHK